MAPALRKGVLLVADTSLGDPNFDGAVVLLCAHSQAGSFGLVLNRPTGVAAEEALPEPGGFAGRGLPLGWGGPVGLDRVHVLHGGPETVPGSEAVLEGVRFGADLAVLAALDAQQTPVRFFVGYSGWQEGQLESELQEGAWRLVPARADRVFPADPVRLWPELMAGLDPGCAWMRDLPPDPWGPE